MSTRIDFIHPNIRLGKTSNGWKPEGPERNESTFRSFQALPADVQARIFRLWLEKERPIHCFSRLDPFTAPASWPVSKSGSGMYNRFYWGEDRLLNLFEDTADPQDVLKLLLVSKAFYFNGVHAFYGLNTFAFSSIGEFGRFCKGIGQERAARLQHLELTWTGSQYLTAEHTFRPNQNNRQIGNWDSVRTRPFASFLRLRRLRTLSIFLNESDPLYERRQYESADAKARLLGRTAQQPNFRKNRSFRTMHGIDYVYALRGLDWVRLYDFYAMNRDVAQVPALRPIRDVSFVADVNRTVTMQKSADEARVCELQNLPLLFPAEEGGAVAAGQDEAAVHAMKPWDPSVADWSTVREFYRDGDDAQKRVHERAPTPNPDGVPQGNERAAAAVPENGRIERHEDNGAAANNTVRGVGNLIPRNRQPESGHEEGRSELGGPSHAGPSRVGPSHGMPGYGMGRDDASMFVRDSDENEAGQEDAQPTRNVQAGPPPRQPTLAQRHALLPRPTLGPARRPERMALQPRSASALNANPSPSRPAPSRPTSQKRPSDNAAGTAGKRQKQAGEQPSTPPELCLSEQQARNCLGPFASCRAISSLLTPFAANLLGYDWASVRDILQDRKDSRENAEVFCRYVAADSRIQASMDRIISALRN